MVEKFNLANVGNTGNTVSLLAKSICLAAELGIDIDAAYRLNEKLGVDAVSRLVEKLGKDAVSRLLEKLGADAFSRLVGQLGIDAFSRLVEKLGADAVLDFLAASKSLVSEDAPIVVEHPTCSEQSISRNESTVSKPVTTVVAPTVVERIINSGRMIRRSASKFGDLAVLGLSEFENWVDELAEERGYDDEVFEAFYTKDYEEFKKLLRQKRQARKAEETSKVDR